MATEVSTGRPADESVGARIREERKRLGLSLAVFAANCGVSKTSQALYEADKRAPDSDYLQRAHSCGANAAYMLLGQSQGYDARISAEVVRISKGVCSWAAKQSAPVSAQVIAELIDALLTQSLSNNRVDGEVEGLISTILRLHAA